MLFVDASDFQTRIDWTLYSKVTQRIAIKSTEGVGFRAGLYPDHRAQAIQYGVTHIWNYHFARPDLNNNPEDEANFQFAVVGPIRSTDDIVLDIEVLPVTTDWVYRFCVQQERNYGRVPIIYASVDYIRNYLQDMRLARFPLWLAYWTYSSQSRPACPFPWTSYAAIQYSDAETFAGVTGLVDANVFTGQEQDDIMPDLQLSQVVGIYYLDGGQWHCKVPNHNYLVKDHILNYYVGLTSRSGPLGGYSTLGLPLENERQINPTFKKQRFERGEVWSETPPNIQDSPPGNGGSYTSHLEMYYNSQDAYTKSLSTISGQQIEISLLSSQLSQIQIERISLLQKLSDAQKALLASGDHSYGKAVLDILTLLTALPPYVPESE